uniref:Orf1p n=1 Tax=Saccharomyces arboricola TaxID=706196 RepID=A0A1D8GYD2_9SACH|nr:Orf1p [Saccharomyces arboricola]AOT85109.1 Orf1p [Saccharomyces arboricola]
MIKWTMINIYLLLKFLMIIINNMIKNNNNNDNYNNITKYRYNRELFSIKSAHTWCAKTKIIKRSYHNNTSLNNKLIIVQKNNDKDNLNMNNFYKWLVGFTDGDGSFYMKGTEKDLKFFYGFHLHKDDISCLENIKNNLKMSPSGVPAGPGTNNININIRETSAQLTVMKKQWMNDNLLPIFDKYPCMTIKYYSYMKWKEALMKSLNKVSNKELMEYKTLINNYEIIDNMEIPYNNMNDHWILGFLEAEGSLTIDNRRNCCSLFITQHMKSKKTLEVIKDYILMNWKPIDNTPNLIKEYLLNNWDTMIYLSKPNKCNVINLTTTNMDFLYYVIIPKFNSMNWYSIKYNSYMNWQSVINIYMKGLHKINNDNIKEYIEYTKNLNKKGINKINYNIELYNSIINNNKPLYNKNYRYRTNSIIHSKKNIAGVGVFVYDLNNTLIKTFTGHVPAGVHFNCSKHEIAKYIKNGNVFMNKYILKNMLLD